MKLEKEDTETVRNPDRRRLLKCALAGVFAAIAGISFKPRSTVAKDRDSRDSADGNPYNDSDIRDGHHRADPD